MINTHEKFHGPVFTHFCATSISTVVQIHMTHPVVLSNIFNLQIFKILFWQIFLSRNSNNNKRLFHINSISTYKWITWALIKDNNLDVFWTTYACSFILWKSRWESKLSKIVYFLKINKWYYYYIVTSLLVLNLQKTSFCVQSSSLVIFG